MGVEVSWLDSAQDTLHYRFIDPWNWTDYETALQQGRQMMREKYHYVCIINDLRGSASVPTSLISKSRNYIANRPANTGLAVFTVDTHFLKVMVDLLTRTLPTLRDKYLMADDFDDAVKQVKTWLKDHSDTPIDSAKR